MAGLIDFYYELMLLAWQQTAVVAGLYNDPVTCRTLAGAT